MNNSKDNNCLKKISSALKKSYLSSNYLLVDEKVKFNNII